MQPSEQEPAEGVSAQSDLQPDSDMSTIDLSLETSRGNSYFSSNLSTRDLSELVFSPQLPLVIAMEVFGRGDYERQEDKINLGLDVLYEYIDFLSMTDFLPRLPVNSSDNNFRDKIDRISIIGGIIKDCEPELVKSLSVDYAVATFDIAMKFPSSTADRLLDHAVNMVYRLATDDQLPLEERLEQYFDLRETSFARPTAIEDITNLKALANLIDFYNASPDAERDFSKLKFIAREASHIGDPTLVGFVDDKSREFGWNLAKQIYQNSRNPEFILGALLRPEYADVRKGDKIAVEAAGIYVSKELIQGRPPKFLRYFIDLYDLSEVQDFKSNHLEVLLTQVFDTVDLETADKIIEKYKPDSNKLIQAASRSAIKHLANGYYLASQELVSGYGAMISDEHFDRVESKLREQINESLLGGSPLILHLLECGRKMKALRHFRENGISWDDIETVVLPENYKGKILIASVGERMFLRSEGEWHKDILKRFREDLRIRGFGDDIADPEGGAHIAFKENGSIRIHNRSDDYGQCDYQLAKSLVEEIYPDREIILG